jgi:hypothetical protein
MTPCVSDSIRPPSLQIRPVQYRDLDILERIVVADLAAEDSSCVVRVQRQFQGVRRWFRVLQLLSLFPNPWRYWFCVQVVEINGQVRGMVQVSPANRTRSTWRIDRVAVIRTEASVESHPTPLSATEIGSRLLRHCFEAILEARTWLLEVSIHDKAALGLYRQHGFQPLAQMTYWAISPEQLQDLAEREPDLPNLLPVSNADAQLLYQLDTVSMPPLVRQVFDRHIQDFKVSLVRSLLRGVQQWMNQVEVVSGYVFEPQRKAAIAWFQLHLHRDPAHPHEAHLTVHPAYTWLYPELFAQIARITITQDLSPQALHVISADYQPEREAYLERIGASRIAHTLLMSRSVWHKLRESKSLSLEGLQLPDVLQGLQPVRRPVPGRITLQDYWQSARPSSAANPLPCADDSFPPDDSSDGRGSPHPQS